MEPQHISQRLLQSMLGDLQPYIAGWGGYNVNKVILWEYKWPSSSASNMAEKPPNQMFKHGHPNPENPTNRNCYANVRAAVYLHLIGGDLKQEFAGGGAVIFLHTDCRVTRQLYLSTGVFFIFCKKKNKKNNPKQTNRDNTPADDMTRSQPITAARANIYLGLENITTRQSGRAS